MPTKRMRLAATLIAPIAIALVVAWFDVTVLAADQQRAIDNYEMDPLMLSMPVGYLLAVAGVLLIALVSRLEPNAVFGGLYAIGGAVLVFAMPPAGLGCVEHRRWRIELRDRIRRQPLLTPGNVMRRASGMAFCVGRG
jgi:hypothetical protein